MPKSARHLRPVKAEFPLTPDLQGDIEDYLFADGGWTGPIGALLAVIGTTVLSWPLLHRSTLIWWAVIGCGAVVMLLVVSVIPRFRQPVDSFGSPWALNFSSLLVGAHFGAIMWVDLDAMADTETRMTLLAILLGVSAGALAGTAAIGGQGRLVLYSVWLFGGSALLLVGQIVLAGAAIAYLLFLVRDLRTSSTVVYEMLALRHKYHSQAQSAQEEAARDALTGLLNRSGLTTRVKALRTSSVTAMYIDLDHFKEINDRLGHAAGDAVLVEAGRRVSSLLRKDDILARVGGDEFFLIFAEPIPQQRQLWLAERIIAELERPFDFAGSQTHISASVGVASRVPGSDKVNLETLQHEADQALYKAKGRGRRQAVLFNNDAGAQEPELQ